MSKQGKLGRYGDRQRARLTKYERYVFVLPPPSPPTTSNEALTGTTLAEQGRAGHGQGRAARKPTLFGPNSHRVTGTHQERRSTKLRLPRNFNPTTNMLNPEVSRPGESKLGSQAAGTTSPSRHLDLPLLGHGTLKSPSHRVVAARATFSSAEV